MTHVSYSGIALLIFQVSEIPLHRPGAILETTFDGMEAPSKDCFFPQPMFEYDALRVSWVCVSRRGARAAVRRDFSCVALSVGRVPLDNAQYMR